MPLLSTKLFFSKTFLSIILVFGTTSISSQTTSSHNYCEWNATLLDQISSAKSNDNKIIVISSRGNREKSIKYSRLRLNILRQKCGNDGVIYALGLKSAIKPKIDVYINGQLEFVFETKNYENLKAVGCGN